MTLTFDLLPASQHYALLGIAIALFSLTLALRSKRRIPKVWPWAATAMVAVPTAQMVWSLWEGITTNAAFGWTVAHLLAHGLAILLIVSTALYMMRRFEKAPKRARVEPTVGAAKLP